MICAQISFLPQVINEKQLSIDTTLSSRDNIILKTKFCTQCTTVEKTDIKQRNKGIERDDKYCTNVNGQVSLKS